MRLRKPAEAEAPSELPPDLARGPDPVVWCPHDRAAHDRGLSEALCRHRAGVTWHAAGDEWSVQHGLGRDGWRRLLSDEVRYAVSPKGRLMPPAVLPWERP